MPIRIEDGDQVNVVDTDTIVLAILSALPPDVKAQILQACQTHPDFQARMPTLRKRNIIPPNGGGKIKL